MNKYLIQIGTAYGNDFFYHDFVCKYDNSVKLILVEPTDYFHQAEDFYNKFNYKYELLRAAIVVNEFNDDHVDLYHYASELTELTSVINRHDLTYAKIEKIKAIKINDLFLKTEKDSEIDLLCLDIEGYDREVLLSADFSLRNINNIIYECAPEMSLDRENKIRSKSIEPLVHEKLNRNGFYKINNSSNEHWAKKGKEILPIRPNTY